MGYYFIQWELFGKWKLSPYLRWLEGRGWKIRGLKCQMKRNVISVYFDERLVNALFGFHVKNFNKGSPNILLREQLFTKLCIT